MTPPPAHAGISEEEIGRAIQPFAWLGDRAEHMRGRNEAKKAARRILSLLRQHIAGIKGERDRLADRVTELECAPWPEWAETMKTAIREVSGYDGYDDATEGVDLPEELNELIQEMTRANEILQARATLAEQRAAEAERALEPFAKAGELFKRTAGGTRDALVYAPAAGPEYNISSGHLLDALEARRSLTQDTPPEGTGNK